MPFTAGDSERNYCWERLGKVVSDFTDIAICGDLMLLILFYFTCPTPHHIWDVDPLLDQILALCQLKLLHELVLLCGELLQGAG